MEAPATTRSLIPRQIALGCAAGAGALAAALLSGHAAHAALHHAALVVEHSSGSVISRCVAFAEEQISGLQLIQRSGVEFQAQTFGSMGSAMCQLDDEPSPVPPGCFGSGPYWQYSRHQGGGWQTSAVGASGSVLRDGDMDGWRYAGGAGQAPPTVAFASVCTAPSPAAATQAAVAPPSVRSMATPVPAATSTAPAAPSLQAAAPTASSESGTALTATGPGRPRPAAVGPWLLLAGAATLLLGLGAINLRRRGR